jgi:F5/8 type C domain/PA14 domain
MKPVTMPALELVALAGASDKIESTTDVAQSGTTLNVRLKKILVAGVACFALGCTSAQAQDMALNKPASASSTEDDRTDLRPALANDGNSASRWSSNYADNQWWHVDLGSVRQINRVELNWEAAYASRYTIRTRRSGNSWSTAATLTASSPGLKVHTFPVRSARYVRIEGDQRATRWGISLWDVRVFGPTSPPSPPDGDGDGVPDSTDQCLTQPGPASNGGCPLPDPPPADCQTGEFLARYWSNQTLSGLPVLSRCEASINNDFGTGSPPGVPADGFSARYEGRINFDAADYEFALTVDDGVRLWVDGDLVIDGWVNRAATTYRATRAMTAGVHNVRVEYYEASGQAVVRLAITKQVVPPPPPPPPPPGAVTVQQVDGGPAYFGRFVNAAEWTSPNHFMIASWCRPVHEQAQVNRYLDFGLNTIICLENPELTNEALLRQNGLKAIVQSNERTRFNDIGTETLGWNGGDEFDMTQGGEFRCENGEFQQELSRHGIGANGIGGDNRLIHVNYGKGVGIWSRLGFGGWTDQRAACYVNHPWVDYVSIDTYYLTDTSTQGHGHRRGYAYGNDIDRLRYLDGFDGQRKPTFLWVELGPPGSGETFAPQPAEVRSAVWHSIIAGARGVGYFDHNFGTDGGVNCGSTILRGCYPQIYAMAQATNQQIKDLAPVISSPFVTSGHSLSGAQTRRMVKWHNGRFYVFLASYEGGSATFSMPCVGNATAVRLAPSNMPGEAASIPVNGGSFTDSFADKNAVHIYRVDGGSTCGLG